MKTQVFRLDEISPAEYNPRQDLKPGDKQYEAIRHSIEAYGFVEPLVVNVRDGKNILVGGHQRYKICGFNIHAFYMKHSKQNGYKRLNRGIKAPIITQMRDFTHSLGLRFHVSDAFCRECNDACNCCGVPPEWDVSQTGNIGQAIIIARTKGEVRFSDVAPGIYKFFNGFRWASAEEYNTGSNKARALKYDMTMAEFLRNNWNNIKGATSPARAYGGILKPSGLDEKGDVIYKYNGKR